jgi:hypothetical protein
MTTPRRGHPPWSRAAWEASLPTIVLGLACSSSTRLSREGHSVEQLVPARGSPPTTPFCADASGEDLAGVPPELLPPKKRPVRYHPYYASSTIQEIASHGRGGGFGFGNRPVPLTVERDGDGFGNLPVPLNVEGDGEGFRNLPVPLTAEGDGDGFGHRLVPPTVERDDEGLRAVLRRLRISQPALVLTKRLTLSDRSREHARLILPDGLVSASPLLGTMTAGERHLVLGGGGLPVQAFDRLGRVYHMMLKRDRAANTYRLAGEWTLFLSRHRGMRDGDDVEVFAFRPPDWQARLVRCGEAGLGLALLHYGSARTRTMDEANGLQLLEANPVRPERQPRRRRRRSGHHNLPARFA